MEMYDAVFRAIGSMAVILLALLPLLAHGQLLPEKQQALAARMAAKVHRAEVWKDEKGNITGLILINHQALTRQTGEKPGVNDADLARLNEFPELTAINLEAPGLLVMRIICGAEVPKPRMARLPAARAWPATSRTGCPSEAA